MKKSTLTYICLALITIGGAFASFNKQFAGLYSVFVSAVLTAKGCKHVASLTSQYLDNKANANTSPDPTLNPITPSLPIPQKPLSVVQNFLKKFQD